MSAHGTIRAGIGGWTFAPWRGVFYPEKLPQAKELHFASRALSTIEINGTYYRSQTPATFAKWARDVPDGFVFALKGPRFATNRRVLAEAGDSIKRFLDSGPTMLGDRLGPILWQFAPTKKLAIIRVTNPESRLWSKSSRLRFAQIKRPQRHHPLRPCSRNRGLRRENSDTSSSLRIRVALSNAPEPVAL